MSKETDDDDIFFHSQMQGVKPLKVEQKVTVKKRSTVLLPRKKRVTKPRIIEFQFSDQIRETVTASSKLSFARSGLQHKVLLALRTGEIKQQAVLDLHGANVEQARDLLSLFLSDCLEKELRCVRVIHGKGKEELSPPILKNLLNSWLPQHPAVLAYTSCTTQDGGTGAVYVLLKRKKSRDNSNS